MPWVFVPNEWGPDRTRLMNQYIDAIVQLLTIYETGPDELGLTQIMDEMNTDQEMFQAVWAHLYTWQRNLLLDIRERHDRRRQTAPRLDDPREHRRAVRGTKG
jgi:hypothetical protein